MTFANGNRSLAICDRCGQQYKYLQLRQEWNGLHVCPECFEPKHPQLDPGYHPADPIALQDPRPESNKILTANSPTGPNDAVTETFGQPMPMVVFVGDPGDSGFMTTTQSVSPDDGGPPTGTSRMLPQVPNQKLTVLSFVGKVSVVIS